MTGYMRKRGADSWQLLVHTGTDKDGKKRYASKTVHGSKREAQRALAAFVTEVTKGGLVASGPVSVEAVVRAWLKARSPNLSASTVARYETALKLIVPALGKIPVARLRTRDIEDFYGSLVARGQSGSSIRKVHWAMRQSLAWAKRHGYVATLATDGLELPPLGERKLEPPASVDVQAVIDAALGDDRDFGTLLAFMAWTGCRRGEVCALRWRDLDLDQGEALFARSIVPTPDGLQEKEPKTGESRRIAIGKRTVRLLQEHRERCVDRAAACEAALEPSAFVFSLDPAGRTPMHPITVTHRFVAARTDAGVPPFRLHDLRHHSATTLLKHGVSVGEVMDRHGWKTLAMVGRYRHFLQAQDRQAAEALEKALSG